MLKHLRFIDDNATVLLKGRVACEINSAPELILTELILENILAEYTPHEVVALLSIFVFVEKSDAKPVIPNKLVDGLETIYRIADEVEREQDRCSVQYEEFKEKFKPGLVEVVYEWANGMVRLLFRAEKEGETNISRSSRSPSSLTCRKARSSASSLDWMRLVAKSAMRRVS